MLMENIKETSFRFIFFRILLFFILQYPLCIIAVSLSKFTYTDIITYKNRDNSYFYTLETKGCVVKEGSVAIIIDGSHLFQNHDEAHLIEHLLISNNRVKVDGIPIDEYNTLHNIKLQAFTVGKNIILKFNFPKDRYDKFISLIKWIFTLNKVSKNSVELEQKIIHQEGLLKDAEEIEFEKIYSKKWQHKSPSQESAVWEIFEQNKIKLFSNLHICSKYWNLELMQSFNERVFGLYHLRLFNSSATKGIALDSNVLDDTCIQVVGNTSQLLASMKLYINYAKIYNFIPRFIIDDGRIYLYVPKSSMLSIFMLSRKIGMLKENERSMVITGIKSDPNLLVSLYFMNIL